MSYYLSLFKALDAAGVRYVVVGGLATVLHGYARFTADVDLVMEVFSFFDPLNPVVTVDLFVYEPVPFHELVLRAKRMDIGGIRVPVCSIDDLIGLKMKAARPRDLDDIEHLREIQRIQEQGGQGESEGTENS